MPFVIHPRVRKGLGRLAALTAFGVLASTGVAAAASCPTTSTTTPFSQFGDNNSYFVAPGGTFEGASLAAGASTSGSVSLTEGNEPWHVVSASDKQSVTIRSGGSVTLPFTCVDSTMTDFRFFARQVAGGGGLRVSIVVQTPGGWHLTVPLAHLADGSMNSWAPTAPIFAPPGLALARGLTVQAALKFSVPYGGGAWQIDDVLVDPYSFG
jgi:hypothetical protein